MTGAKWAFGAFWALLVALRLVYLRQYLELPFAFGPLFDSQVYLAQADAVRAGRFGDPTLLAFSPLYGYLLAALDARSGALLPLILQLGLGVANVWLLFRVTFALFGQHAARWAALCWALYGPVMFFELKIMSETLGLTLLLLALERFTSTSFRAGSLRTAFLVGLWLCFAVWARASLLFTLPFFVGAALLPQLKVLRGSSVAADGNAGRRALRSGARQRVRSAFVLGVALIGLFGSYGVLMRVYTGLFVPVILVSNSVAQATAGDWQGNLEVFADAQHPVGAFSVVEQARARLRVARSGELAAESHWPRIDLAGFLRQLPRKLVLTFRDLETTFDYGYYGERSEVSALYIPFLTFGFVAIMAALGGVALVRAGQAVRLVALTPLLVGVVAVTTLFHPSTRYRLPLLVALAPLAGVACARAYEAFVAKRRAPLFVVIALALGSGFVGSLRGLSHPGMWHLRVAESAAMAGERAVCEARVQSALLAEPNDPEVHKRARYVLSLLRTTAR